MTSAATNVAATKTAAVMSGARLIEKWPELRKLSDKQVLDGVKRCAGEEREALLRLLFYLSEVDRREAYEHAGKRSLWPFLEETMGFSTAETRLRFYSTKLLREFPIVLEYLADGRLSMTTLVAMNGYLTGANVRDACIEASGKSLKEVERIVASKKSPILDFATLSPGPAPTITEVPNDVIAGRLATDGSAAASTGAATGAAPLPAGKSFVVTGAPSKQKIKALTSEQFLLTMTVPRDFDRDLTELGDLLGPAIPDTKPQTILGYLMKGALERLRKKRGLVPVKTRAHTDARVTTPEPAASAVGAPTPAAKPYALRSVIVPADAAIDGRNRDRTFTREAIPRWLARFVWIRDNQCCQRRLKNGQICGSTHQCQLDHIQPVADGGKSTMENLRVHCRRHNLERARERFGSDRIQRAIARRETQRHRSATKTATTDPLSSTTRSRGDGQVPKGS